MTGAFRPPDQVLPQDWVNLGQWLAAIGRHLDREAPIKQFSGGLANLNYLVSVDGTSVVLRRPPSGPLAEGANDMAREWKVLNGLVGRFALAPRPVVFCDDPAVLGAPFQLIEYREGASIRDSLPAKVTEPTAGRLLTGRLLDAMAALHGIDPTSRGLDGLGRPSGFLERQVEGWARRSSAAFGTTEPGSVAAIVRHLKADLPHSNAISLLHCDLKFDNVLFDLTTLQPVAILDWDMATRGDPLFDLAVLLSYWVEPGDPEPVRDLRQVPSLSPGFPTRSDVAASYFSVSGRSPTDLGFYLTLARFRLAVAWQQMYVQYQRKSLVDPRYASFHALAMSILEWTATTRHDPI